MQQLYRTLFALLLCVTIVAPSVYVGLVPPQEARAQEDDWNMTYIGAVTTEVATAAAAGYASCTVGGWIQNWLAGFLPWLSPVVPAVAAAKTVPASQLSGAAAAGQIGGITGAAVVAGRTTHVPSADPFITGALGSLMVGLTPLVMNSGVSASAALSSAANDGAVTFKKCVLDPLMWAAKDAFIQIITNDIIDWIEGGFEGTPAFLTDPSDFFLGVADVVLQDFLYESGLDAFLCEPFALDVVFGISMEYSRPAYGEWGSLSCSLDEIFPGIDINIDTDGDGINDTTVRRPDQSAAYDQATSDGNIHVYGIGLKGAAAMADPWNNHMGTELELQQQVNKYITQESSEESMKLQMGRGWFSLECDTDDDFVKDGICTPGEFVASHINNYTNSALEELTIADEFSEILNALFSALVEQLLQEVTDGGGLGLRR